MYDVDMLAALRESGHLPLPVDLPIADSTAGMAEFTDAVCTAVAVHLH